MSKGPEDRGTRLAEFADGYKVRHSSCEINGMVLSVRADDDG